MTRHHAHARDAAHKTGQAACPLTMPALPHERPRREPGRVEYMGIRPRRRRHHPRRPLPHHVPHRNAPAQGEEVKTERAIAYLRSKINAPTRLKAVWVWQSVADHSVTIRVATTDRREFMVKILAEQIAWERDPERVILAALNELANQINTQAAQPHPELIRDYVTELMKGN